MDLPRYRCTACGNLTRFDVVESRRTRAFHHYTVGGELMVEDEEVLDHAIESVECRWCGPAGGGGGPGRRLRPGPPLTPTDEELRPVLETAFVVVVRGASARPPVAPPPTLRPYLRFQKLPTAALGVVRRALDDDADLRARVAIVASDELVGALGRVWLTRPEGWEDEVERLRADDETGSAADGERRDRRREVALTASRRLAAELVVVRDERDHARTELAAARDERRGVDEERRAAGARIGELERRLAEATREVAALRAERDAAVARADEATAHLAVLGECLAEAERARDEALGASVVDPPTPPPEPSASPAWDPRAVAQVAGAVQRAGEAAALLGRTLAEAAGWLAVLPGAVDAEADAATAAAVSGAGTDPAAPVGGLRAGARGRPGKSAGVSRRRARPLPGGVLDDSTEAAGHLLRLPGVAVVVDGYNVAKAAWPHLSTAEQRTHLLDAMEALAARTGTQPMVVFDGADVGSVGTGSAPRQQVRVRFSPAGVEADDVVLELAAEVPATRPVVVVSSDRRVRDGARALGANVMSTAQCRAVMGV